MLFTCCFILQINFNSPKVLTQVIQVIERQDMKAQPCLRDSLWLVSRERQPETPETEPYQSHAADCEHDPNTSHYLQPHPTSPPKVTAHPPWCQSNTPTCFLGLACVGTPKERFQGLKDGSSQLIPFIPFLSGVPACSLPQFDDPLTSSVMKPSVLPSSDFPLAALGITAPLPTKEAPCVSCNKEMHPC